MKKIEDTQNSSWQATQEKYIKEKCQQSRKDIKRLMPINTVVRQNDYGVLWKFAIAMKVEQETNQLQF